ncbi:alpha(1,3)fucosyltransferase gene 2 isoform X1 [Danio rerio]|uniref:Fucosyltransferase n=2 Tax=Danio rerio TaxID=7955 RepID=A0A8M2BFK1_DANRE|nr:alpha(1,3)fucosyltransferase gene 2 isoform X1 [Danio rerio]|eukprot:XP_005168265.1 alpha(1,3)fucosyltransferase gene 2 isoform X1 [Danio rerio]
MVTLHRDALDFLHRVMNKITVMDKLTPPSKSTQKLILVTFMLISFVCIFYVYYNPNTTFFKYPTVGIHANSSCSETCLHVLKMQNYECIMKNASDNPLTTPAPNPAKEDQDIIVLIWMAPFGVRFDLKDCGSEYNIHGCQLTYDRSMIQQAHGVMFHHRDMSADFPQPPRPAFQKWIWWNMESPSHCNQNDFLNDRFNVTSSYNRNSDIPVPYGRLVDATDEQKNFTIPKKDKLVCWIVSNFQEHHKRTHFYYEFAKHINVETYGGHFNNRINSEDYGNVVSSCKFYLSFENSIHRDYFTEKLFNPLALGTVPVVIGPPRYNYEEFIPRDAFIHVDDFPSPKELADHLISLDQNEEQYKQFFNWRKLYVSKSTSFGLEHSCKICDYLKRNKHYIAVTDLKGWFWG